jgi:integrase
LFWRAAGDLGEPFSQALKLLLLTGQRRTEVAGMRRSELDGDAWLLPANRSRIRGPTPCRCRKRRRT